MFILPKIKNGFERVIIGETAVVANPKATMENEGGKTGP
jgi:hypothetical protein